MRKNVYFALFFIVFVTIIDGKCNRKQKILSISGGSSFGFCRSYCRRSINITSNENKLVAVKEGNYPQVEYPLVSKEYPYSSNEYQQLVNLIQPKQFQALDDVIGCPDCADGGSEWIEIQWTKTIKRVTFEYGKTITGFTQLVEQLRQLRVQYAETL